MKVGDRLREARLALGKTQEQVALESKMNVTQYNGYERGRSRPAPATLKRIAEALQVTPEALLGLPASADASVPLGSRDEGLRALRSEFQGQVAAILGLAPAAIAVRIEVL
jgi:transcriptional regulator with XRE-family HTH domain